MHACLFAYAEISYQSMILHKPNASRNFSVFFRAMKSYRALNSLTEILAVPKIYSITFGVNVCQIARRTRHRVNVELSLHLITICYYVQTHGLFLLLLFFALNQMQSTRM